MLVKSQRNRIGLFAIIMLLLSAMAAQGGRTNKMFDISQTARPDWGTHWCAPTAVGNSFAWLAKEYSGLGGLAKKSDGTAMSAEDIIDTLGKDYMSTGPTTGTTDANLLAGKKAYIKAHGLENKIKIETMSNPTKAWLKEQYAKGQDVEIGLTYYKLEGGVWKRTGGHVQTYGDVPGYDVGGHAVSLADIYDPYNNDLNTDFQIAFTDPGRNDLTGDYGAIADDEYDLTDAAGNVIHCVASTYNVIWENDVLGDGVGGLLLDGYQGAGDFVSDGTNRIYKTVVDMAWAESPVPAPGALVLAGIGLAMVRRRRGF